MCFPDSPRPDGRPDVALHQREALVLRYYLDLPLEEVAAITGAPLGTVKSRLNRGLAALRPHFEPVEAVT